MKSKPCFNIWPILLDRPILIKSMNPVKKHPLNWLISCVLLCSLLLPACDVLNITVQTVPSATVEATRTGTPRPKVTLTPQPSATPTIPFYLDIPESALQGVQIRFWHPWQGDLAWQTADRVVAFNNTNPWGITVNFYAPDGTTETIKSIQDSLQDNTQPNVVIASSSYLAAWQAEYKNIINLDDYINSMEYGLTAQEMADFYPAIWQQDKLEDRRFGFPIQRDAYVLVYNQTWAEELGYATLPTTPAQFQNQICSANKAIQNDDDPQNDGTGGWIVRSDEGETLSWLLAFEYEGLPNLYQDQYQFMQASSIRSFRFLRYLYDSQCSWSARNPSPYEYFAKRQTLAFSARLSELPDIQTSMEFNESSDQWTIIPYPGQEKEEILLAEGQSFAMFAGSAEEQMASWLFMKWMNNAEYQAEIIQATSGLPITKSVLDETTAFQKSIPQWANIIDDLDNLQAMPNGSQWNKARSVLVDANWQLYQQAEIKDTSEAMSLILNQLDLTINELIGKE
jgi:multiple sugar transport system substrate-binding protein